MLSGRYLSERKIEPGTRFDKNAFYQNRYWNDRVFDLIAGYNTLAEKAGMSLLDFAYAWLGGAPVVSSILLGPATVAHLDAALDALEKTVPPEIRSEVDAIHRAFQGTDTMYAR